MSSALVLAVMTFVTSDSMVQIATGPLVDAQCNMETVEEANAHQLYALLTELSEATFFRLINVNMEGKCPYWGGPEVDEPECESKSDETAVPLCTVGPGEESNPFASNPFSFSSPSMPMTEAEDFVDQTISPEEDEVIATVTEADCSNEELPTFWLDMCSAIPTNASDYVNLQLNKESYTGYNGSHVWQAIYNENCLQRTGGHDNNMCYEERVLYRLLSGMHAATNTHIARYYYAPSKRKNRSEWEPNLEYFSRQFHGHPERLKNLHFAFVVLLRSIRRGTPYLSSYDFGAGDPEAGVRAQALVRRLLDSSILKSCSAVFDAFDEGLLFREQQAPWWSLKKQFKGVFHNVSRVLDCVSCQKCRLHAKVTMLGFGAALKMLLLPPELLATAFSREEIVALFNTLAKFSSAIHYVKYLTQMQYKLFSPEIANTQRVGPSATPPAPPSPSAPSRPPRVPSKEGNFDVGDAPYDVGMLDGVMAQIAALSKNGELSAEHEIEAVRRVLQGDALVTLLAHHFRGLPTLARHLQAALQHPVRQMTAAPLASATAAPASTAFDVAVIGSGVAGLTTTLRLLDSGARVALVDKERRIGGNSAKASSGINGCCPAHSRSTKNKDDSVTAFIEDTAKSARREPTGLISLLASSSQGAIEWLLNRTSIDLSKVAQLGGHKYARTHRPANGMIGAELVFALQKEVRKFEQSGQLKLLLGNRVTELLQDEHGRVIGVAYEQDGSTRQLLVPQTVLATGGFANDRSNASLLALHRPDLVRFPTTNGVWATGDGMKMAMAIGAGTVDMDKVQVHPTGFVDPAEPEASTKVLCGEMMRGVGGLLVTPNGSRFVNELSPRDKVVDAQLATGAEEFGLILNAEMAAEAGKHVELYSRKGLLVKVHGVSELATWMSGSKGVKHASNASALEVQLSATLEAYNHAAAVGADAFGKQYFTNAPLPIDGVMYVGRIVPVVHYCMGGITMDEHGAVLRSDGTAVPGLHAAGEVTGGVHGENRLGGNSLLECTVFGSIVGEKLAREVAASHVDPQSWTNKQSSASVSASSEEQAAPPGNSLRRISLEELSAHSSSGDYWVALHGKVYDLSGFVDEHPAGAESITKLAGADGTPMYQTVHNLQMLADFENEVVGILGTD